MLLKKGNRGEEVKALQRVLHLFDDGIFGPLTEEAVKEFQSSNGLTADGVVGDKTWTKLTGGVIPSKRVIKEIIVHCTATPEGKDFTVADIRRWHTSPPNNWSDIGYHYVVYRDGSINNGRDINVAGAHCTGHNTGSIGIVYVGGQSADGKKDKDTRTAAQKDALVKLLKQLRTLYPSARIYGHSNFAAKACPCFDAGNEYRSI